MQSENKDLLVLLLITGGIAIFGFAIFFFLQGVFIPELSVSSYDAVFSWDGTLSESYIYKVHVNNQFRSLNRIFEVPVYSDAASGTYIRYISMQPPAGTTGYLKDMNGKVILTNQITDEVSVIKEKAGYNEAGAFKAGYYSHGVYPVSYTWDIIPPVERGTDADHLNIDLATTHIPYDSVTITIPSQGVLALYPHPADLSVRKTADSYTITGSAAEDIPLGFEVIIDPLVTEQLQGQIRVLSGSVREETEKANPWYLSYTNSVYHIITWITIGFLFLIPLALLLVWWRYGREKAFSIPDHLSFVPDPKLKPWLVSLIFTGDPEKFDEDGLHATLLDLHRRGIISISQKPENGFSIQVLKFP